MPLWKVCQRDYFPSRLSIRSQLTVAQYRYAVNDLGRFLGRAATLADLSDDALSGLAKMLLERGCSAKTANERVGRLKTLWTWLARRGHVRLFPTLERFPEPRRLPSAWTQDELKRLFESCDQEDLPVGKIPGPQWWRAFHGLAWNTSERRGALMAIRWDWLDRETGMLAIPAEARKSQVADMIYQLWPETMQLLEAIRQPPRELVLPWPYSWPSTFYNRYHRILRRAGLPVHRKNGPHKMRVSHATWVKAISGKHASSLGHASSSTTERHYEDPRICRIETPKLFVPWRKRL